MEKKFLSWNVNGIRAVEKKGFLAWLESTKADIVALQETKAWSEQLSENLKNVKGYFSYFSQPQRKGYSGVGVYTKIKPISVSYTMNVEEFDAEGRYICLEFENFFFINIYFPNGGQGPHRIDYKLRFYDIFFLS